MSSAHEIKSVIVSCRVSGQVRENNFTDSILFNQKGFMISSPEEEPFFTIRKNAAGHVLKFSDTENVLYNGRPFIEKEDSSGIGRGAVLLNENDVFRIGKNRQRSVFIYHERSGKQVHWQHVTLKKDRKYRLLKHDEDVSRGEVLSEEEAAPAHYAELYYENDSWYVRDVSTVLGVFVNNVQIEEPAALQTLDVLRIGNTSFILTENRLLHTHIEHVPDKLEINIRSRTAGRKKEKVLLKDISMEILPGQMVLILGGSGAGKTTFVNAVLGYEKADGTIISNGQDLYENYNSMKADISFVPQADLLRGADTVYHTLYDSARIHMPASADKEQIEARISETLSMFGLDSAKNSFVSKISGGKRRRVAIAQEYINDPTLFVLDEPDSGLDGAMARSLMLNLRQIADQNKIVMVISHSPDRAADLFDNVIVLAKDKDNAGRLAFYGGIAEARTFFDAATMVDIVKKINRPTEGGEGLADYYIAKYADLVKGAGHE